MPGAGYIDDDAPDECDLARDKRLREDFDARLRRTAEALALAADLRRRAAMRQCQGCTCGGKGLCRDAA